MNKKNKNTAALIGPGVDIPLNHSACFESILPTGMHSYLLDHRVRGRSIMPAAGYISLMTEAAYETGLVPAGDGLSLDDLRFYRPLNLAQGVVRIQTLVQRENLDRWELRVLAKSEKTNRWRLYAFGEAKPTSSIAFILPADFSPQNPEHVDVDRFYERWFQRGLQYGRRFRALAHLTKDGETTSAKIVLPTELNKWPGSLVHPVILDAAIQTLGTLLPQYEPGAGLPLPIGVESFIIRGRLNRHTSVIGKLRPKTTDERIVADLYLGDIGGRNIAEIRGLTLAWADAAPSSRRGSANASSLEKKIQGMA